MIAKLVDEKGSFRSMMEKIVESKLQVQLLRALGPIRTRLDEIQTSLGGGKAEAPFNFSEEHMVTPPHRITRKRPADAIDYSELGEQAIRAMAAQQQQQSVQSQQHQPMSAEDTQAFMMHLLQQANAAGSMPGGALPAAVMGQ